MPTLLRRFHRRPAVRFAVLLLTVTTGVVVASAAGQPALASTGDVSPCLPYQLPGLPGNGNGNGEIAGMNDAGIYVGAVHDGPGVGLAAWWTHGGSDLNIGWTLHVPGFRGEFLDVNPSGVMTGFNRDTGDSFVYDSNSGDFHVLPDFDGGYATYGRRINAFGVVSGSAGHDDAGYAAIWRRRTPSPNECTHPVRTRTSPHRTAKTSRSAARPTASTTRAQ